MYVALDKLMPNGSQATVHTLEELVIRPGEIIAVVISRTAVDGIVCWQDRITVPALSGEPYRVAIDVLTAPGGYLEGGEVMVDPSPPEQLRATMLTTLSRLRDDRLAGGCATPFGRIDTDLISRQNISGAVAMAMLAKSGDQPFSIRWRMRDNSYVELGADQMITVGVIVGQFVSAVYAVAFSTKDSIEQAEDAEALEGIGLGDLAWPA